MYIFVIAAYCIPLKYTFVIRNENKIEKMVKGRKKPLSSTERTSVRSNEKIDGHCDFNVLRK